MSQQPPVYTPDTLPSAEALYATLLAEVGRIDLGPIHAMWPQITSLRPLPTILALGAAYVLLRLQWSLPLVLALAALASALGGML